jgi:hypothetical protein
MKSPTLVGMTDLRYPLAIALLLTACGPDAIAEDDDVGDDETESTSDTSTDTTDTSTDTSDTSTDTTDTTTGDAMPECEQACAVLGEGSCYTTQTCLDACEQGFGEAWTPALADAFASCMADNPLCFESIEGCMLSTLYPAGSETLARVSGSGFGEHEGATVYVWHDPQVPPDVASETTVVEGAFELEWVDAWPVFDTGGPLFLLYVDVDGNAVCEPGVDVTASVITQWNGSFAAPVFEAELVAPANPSDFVCNTLP